MVATGAAVVAHAAAVSWSATSVKDINAASAKNVSGWTVVCTIYAANQTTIIGSDTDTTSNAMSKFNGTIDGTANNTTYYAQLVMTDAAGNTIKSEMAQFVGE